MVTDDLAAWAAISIGALATAALTLVVKAPADDHPAPGFLVAEARPASFTSTPDRIVDYAIIRSGARLDEATRDDIETMTDPESAESGWTPPALEIRLLRSR